MKNQLNMINGRQFFLPIAALAILLFANTNALFAQAYEEDAIKTDWNKLVRSNDDQTKEIKAMLTGASELEAGKFTQFFLEHFAHFTRLEAAHPQPDPKKPTAKPPKATLLGDYRTQFKSEFMKMSPANNAALQRLNFILTTRMARMAKGLDVFGKTKKNYHPLVRTHAALFLYELNENELEQKNPYKGNYKSLLELASPTIEKEIPYDIRIIAMNGLLRHVKANTVATTDYKDMIDSVVMPWLLATKITDPKQTREGHDWIRRQAIELATAMNIQSKDAQSTIIVNLLPVVLNVVAEENAWVGLRLAAVDVLVANKALAEKLEADKTAKAVASVAVSAAKNQLKIIVAETAPPYTADVLKAELTRVENGLNLFSGKADSVAKMAPLLQAVIKACDVKFDNPDAALAGVVGSGRKDDDALYKALKKSAAELDKAITGLETSSLTDNFVKLPDNSQGAGPGGTPGVRGTNRFPDGGP